MQNKKINKLKDKLPELLETSKKLKDLLPKSKNECNEID